jgi:hypothetical protein
VDAGGARIDEWFCAATLFGTPISASTAVRAYGALADAGVHTVLDAGERSWEDLVGLLDAGGYGRYDFRTATRLQQLAAEVRTRFGGTVASLATVTDPRVLEATLDALPGWGLTTVRIFLRELRDVWPGAQPPLDERALRGARHLKIPLPRRRSDQIDALRAVADGVQRMCGISRLRSYASAWRIAICARVRVVGGVGGSPFWGRVRRDDASARRTPFAGIVRIRCFGGHRPESVSQPVAAPSSSRRLHRSCAQPARVPRAGGPYSTLNPSRGSQPVGGTSLPLVSAASRVATPGCRARRMSRTGRPYGSNASRRTIGDGRMLRVDERMSRAVVSAAVAKQEDDHGTELARSKERLVAGPADDRVAGLAGFDRLA